MTIASIAQDLFGHLTPAKVQVHWAMRSAAARDLRVVKVLLGNANPNVTRRSLDAQFGRVSAVLVRGMRHLDLYAATSLSSENKAIL